MLLWFPAPQSAAALTWVLLWMHVSATWGLATSTGAHSLATSTRAHSRTNRTEGYISGPIPVLQGPRPRKVLVTTSSQDAPPQTHPFDSSLLAVTPDIPLVTLLGTEPMDRDAVWQVRVGYQGPGRYLLSWSGGPHKQSANMVPTTTAKLQQTADVGATVRYGLSSTSLTMNATAVAVSYSLNLTLEAAAVLGYTSPRIYHALLAGLASGTTYYYVISSSPAVLKFSTLPAGLPLRIGVMGDIGQTPNTSDTLRHLRDNTPQLVINVGDLSYADNYLTDTVSITEHGRRWDSWGVLTQALLSAVPALHTNGNHELETHTWEPAAPRHVAYNARYPGPACEGCELQLQPNTGPGSASNMYYAVDVPGAHVVALTSYIQDDTLDSRSAQYMWLEADLKSVNRSLTPWLLVVMHSPWYSTYVSHFKENECMRQGFEGLFYAYGVDVVLVGHVHAYERTQPVHNYKVDPCGPVHITVGDGGNREGLYRDFVDTHTPDFCSNPQERGRCRGVAGDDSSFCYTQQPKWSAVRDPSFGHGVLTIVDDTTATWGWHRNQDARDVVADSVTLTRNTDACLGGKPAAPAATVPGAAAPAETRQSPAAQAGSGVQKSSGGKGGKVFAAGLVLLGLVGFVGMLGEG